jgi:hypothetical protein
VISLLALGLLWAVFYDQFNSVLPLQYPSGPSNSPETWNILLWIWNAGTVILGLTICLASGRSERKNQYGPSIVPSILSAFELFTAWSVLLFIWIVLYAPINVIIPGAFNSWAISLNPSYSPPDYLLTIYNASTIFLMLGFGVAAIARST